MVNNSEMEEQDNPEKRQREERKQQNVFGDAVLIAVAVVTAVLV